MTAGPRARTEPALVIATSIEAALEALASGARPIAGGTDLVVGARQGKRPLPDSMVAIDRVESLGRLERDPASGGLRIGATVSHARLLTAGEVVERYTALADGAALVGSPATRNAGTLGGNVMNGSPAMDTGAPLVVFGASVELRSVSASRLVPMVELWTGPGATSAEVDELCTAIILPPIADRTGSAYVRLEYRRAMEIAVVGAAALVTLEPDGSVASAAAALTAVAPTIMAVTGLEVLRGAPADDRASSAIAALASDQAAPITDLRAGDRYRRHTVGVMARRAFEAAVDRARGEVIGVPVNHRRGIGAAP